MKRLLLVLLVLVVAAGLWLASYLDRQADTVLTDEAYEFTVARGDSMRGLANQLVAAGLLTEPWSMRFWARYRGLAGSLKAGEYRLEPGATLNGLLDKVTRGDVVNYAVTIIEGWTFRQMRDALAEQPKLAQETSAMEGAAIMTQLGVEGTEPEGRFFPDTYHYTLGMSDLDILRQARQRMDTVLADAWASRQDDLPLATPYEALILASIIEKETGVAEERAEIAGVFINRLRAGMRLQTDPTVIYGMGEAFDGNIRKRDLLTDTPYNTYTRAGLPPTPIALPGEDSIRAALDPARTDARYFVARGDGTHQFSATLEEHNAAVAKYQLKRRSQPARTSD